MSEDRPTNQPKEAQAENSPHSPTDLPEDANPENAEFTEQGEKDQLRHTLEEKAEELRTAQDKYLRLAAEFDNYKRRSQRDQSDAIKFANEKLIKDVLPILDNLERAIQSGQEQKTTEALLEGVILTHKQFLETLTKIGVQQISSIGEPFDPTKHQAVAQVESSEVQPNTIIEEFQKGYFLHERIIRPAMVTVAKQPSDQETTT